MHKYDETQYALAEAKDSKWKKTGKTFNSFISINFVGILQQHALDFEVALRK